MPEPYVGEIRVFPYDYAPQGWVLCHGQLMAISQNTALFSIFGTTYGGDGVTTFGIPDLRGRIAVHVGQGSGLSPYALGQRGGTETVTLTLKQLPSHSHPANCLNDSGDTYQPDNTVWAKDAGENPQFGKTKAAGTMSPNIIGPIGYGQPHNNLQPYLTLNYAVSLNGTLPVRP